MSAKTPPNAKVSRTVALFVTMGLGACVQDLQSESALLDVLFDSGATVLDSNLVVPPVSEPDAHATPEVSVDVVVDTASPDSRVHDDGAPGDRDGSEAASDSGFDGASPDGHARDDGAPGDEDGSPPVSAADMGNDAADPAQCPWIPAAQPGDDGCGHLQAQSLPPLADPCPEDPALNIELAAPWPGLEIVVLEDAFVLEYTFEYDTLIDPAFRVTGADGAQIRWDLEGTIAPLLKISTCTGRLDGRLLWPTREPIVLVATARDGDQCRRTRKTLHFMYAPCAILVEPVTARLPSAIVGEPVDSALSIFLAEDGYGPTYSRRDGRFRLVGGELPPGLRLDCETGHVTGTPTAAGEFMFEVEWAEFDCGGVTGIDTYHMSVVEPMANAGVPDAGVPDAGPDPDVGFDDPEPAPCPVCEPGEICVRSWDGTCGASWTRCVRNPDGCVPNQCTQSCENVLCNDGEEAPFFSCNPMISCSGDNNAFTCSGP